MAEHNKIQVKTIKVTIFFFLKLGFEGIPTVVDYIENNQKILMNGLKIWSLFTISRFLQHINALNIELQAENEKLKLVIQKQEERIAKLEAQVI